MAAGSEKQVHLVIVPYNGQGHLIPALQLAHRLVTLGFKVTYVCHDHRLDQIKKHSKARSCSEKIEFKTMKQSSSTMASGEHDSPTGHDSMQLMVWSFKHHSGDEAEFRELIKSSPPDCIISDLLVSSWIHPVAEELGIPRLALFCSNALALSFEFHVKGLLNAGKIPLKLDQKVLQIPGINSLSPLALDEVSGPIMETTPESLRNFYIENSLHIHNVAGVMCNTFSRLEEEACAAVKTNPELNPNEVPCLEVAPLLHECFLEDDRVEAMRHYQKEECITWLDDQPAHSVVFISFGSFARASGENVVGIAMGLEASGVRFLWVLHDGFAFLPEGFMERTSSRGLVMRSWAPQLLVLSHRSVGGFLSHCGWNSTLESISQGVPMLAMPFYGEQTGNAKIIVKHLKVGVGLEKDANSGLIRREVFEAAFREVIENGEQLRARAAELKEAARAAMKDSRDDVE